MITIRYLHLWCDFVFYLFSHLISSPFSCVTAEIIRGTERKERGERHKHVELFFQADHIVVQISDTFLAHLVRYILTLFLQMAEVMLPFSLPVPPA